MRIKRFKAKNMMEALKKVKAEFGDKAVILDSGKIEENGVSYYEVVAAIEEREPQPEINSPPTLEVPEPVSYDWGVLRSDLLEIKRDIKLLLKNHSFGKYGYLLKEGVPEEIVDLLEKSEKSLEEFLVEVIRKKGVSPLSKVQLFIGEPGVGKTTVIFKMAFWLKMRKNLRVAVLNGDNYKIGGREQAKKLSQLLEIPFYQIDWEDLGKYYQDLLEKFDYLLIDTPSLGKKFSLYELSELYQNYPFLRFHWVARASENPKNLLSLWKEIKGLPLENLTLSFLDKLNQGFDLFWLLLPEIPLPGFASTGERIPEDFERLEQENLLKFFLKKIEKILN